MESKERIYTVTRIDRAYHFGSRLQDMFQFTPFKDEPFKEGLGNVGVEALGFDFQNECSPVLQINPIDKETFKSVGYSVDQLMVSLTITDLALKIRRVIEVIPLADIRDTTKINIDLKEFNELGFYSGFEVGAYITPKETDFAKVGSKIWHKSQILFGAYFVYKASIDESLFEVNFAELDDSKKDVLYYINWRSTDISGSPSDDVIDVVVNNVHKSQFVRLQANSNFGSFAVRQMFASIIYEIIIESCRNADLDQSPHEDSLHQKIKDLLDSNDESFDELSLLMKSGENDAQSAMRRALMVSQLIASSGTSLSTIRFGGF